MTRFKNNITITHCLEPYCKNNYSKEIFDLLVMIILVSSVFFLSLKSEVFWINFSCSILLSLFGIRLFEMFHEFEHGIILKNSSLAFLFFYFFGVLSFFPKYVWTYTHNIHHRNVGRLDKEGWGYYPMIDVETYAGLSPTEKRLYRFKRSYWLLFLSPLFIFFISFSMIRKGRRIQKNVFLSALLFFSAIVAIYFFLGFVKLIFLALLPFVLFIWIGTLLLFLQHNYEGVKYFKKEKSNQIDRILKSSNTIKMNAFWRWMTCNSGFHTVHHLQPRIPYYNLKEAHQALSRHANTNEMDFSLSNIRKCYDQKLFSTKLGQTVGWKNAE